MFKCSHVIVSIFVHEVIEVCYLLYKDFYDGKVISNVNRTSTNFYPSRDQTSIIIPCILLRKRYFQYLNFS